MRTVGFLLLCFASFAACLLNESDHHTPDSAAIAPPLSDDASALRLTSFFKLAHSRVTLKSDIRATAVGLVPLYAQLCASVSDCDSGVTDLLADRQNELQLEVDRMDKLHLVLNRVRRLVHSDDGRKHPQHRGLWRRPLQGGVFKHMEA